MKTVCLFEGPYILQDYSEPFLYYAFSLHWHLSLKSPFPAVVLLMAGQVPGTAAAGSFQLHHGLDVGTACSSTTGGTSCQPPPRRSHKQLTLLLLFVDQNTVASSWSVWVSWKAMRYTQCLPAHTLQPPFRNTDIFCCCTKEIPYEHLISWEHL